MNKGKIEESFVVMPLSVRESLESCKSILQENRFAVIQVGQSKLVSVDRLNPAEDASIILSFNALDADNTEIRFHTLARDLKNYNLERVLKILLPIFALQERVA